MTARYQHDEQLNPMQAPSDPSPDLLREMVGAMVQEVLEEEVARHLGAERHERTAQRRGYRNGHRPRTWKTRVGALELDVPQTRGTEPYQPTLFARWERVERALLTTCAEMYFSGVSTRKVARVLEEMGGFSLSAATVSKVAAELDEQLEAFRKRSLAEHAWPYLVVDARYEKVRRNRRVVSAAVLVVAGITTEGRREVLTWQVGDSESEETWASVFGELKRRGVAGVELVVSDAHRGLRGAADRTFSGAGWQRCRVHFLRELLSKVSYKRRDALARDVTAAFGLQDRQLCLQAAHEVAQRWRQRAPRVARAIEEGFEECLAVQDLPSNRRRRLHSTNMLERLMRELKRRTRVVGIFPNDAALDRLVGAQLLDIDERWQCERMRYLVLDQD